jgi:hypothetical protein
LSAIAGEERILGMLVRVIRSGKQALDAVILEIWRMLAERVKLIEREELTGPDYHNTVRPHSSLVGQPPAPETIQRAS